MLHLFDTLLLVPALNGGGISQCYPVFCQVVAFSVAHFSYGHSLAGASGVSVHVSPLLFPNGAVATATAPFALFTPQDFFPSTVTVAGGAGVSTLQAFS